MKHTTWKWFLIRRFLLILLLVALSESLLNLLYDAVVYPWLQDVLHIRFFMMEWESEQNIGLLFRGIIYLAAIGICGQLPDLVGVSLQRMAEQFAGSRLTEYMMDQTRHMSKQESRLYLLGTLALTLLIIFTLLLPYVIAALAFSRMVEQHVRQLEEQERKQREEYDRRRNLLLSDVAHDLKTPMTAVAGYAKVLLEELGGSDEKGSKNLMECAKEKGQRKVEISSLQREYLETIYGKSMQMSGLLNLLFDYVKLDSEGYQLKKTRENLWELLRESVANLYVDFEEKNMEILPEIPEEEVWEMVDKVQFQRVITNLLNNAIRHNPEGTCVWVKAEQGEEGIVIQVCDNGTKIPPEIANYVFDPFVLGDESRRSKGGSGLGLSIAFKIIAMHGGSLRLEQEEGEMYTKAFVIFLPLSETSNLVY